MAPVQYKSTGGRALKAAVLKGLQADNLDQSFAAIDRLPARRAVNPLFSFLHSSDERIKWRTVMAFGRLTAALAAFEMESARVVMRRLLWQLNDESGGIGWGAPEALGQIMAQSKPLAAEYASILISYLDPRGNFIEYPPLQQGVLWGIGRLASARPDFMQPAAPFLIPFLESRDPQLRGLAAWGAVSLQNKITRPVLKRLIGDTGQLHIFFEGEMFDCVVGRLARGYPISLFGGDAPGQHE